MEAFANRGWRNKNQARLELAQLTAEGDRLAFSTDVTVIDRSFFPRRAYRQTGDLRVRQADVAVSGAIPAISPAAFIA